MVKRGRNCGRKRVALEQSIRDYATTELREATMPQPTTASGVEYVDLVAGHGQAATGPGQFLTVHYTGWLTDGTVFDSSRERGEPYGFPLGVGLVIPGWDEGLLGMRVGGLRRLTIPSRLAYGSKGMPGVIPPDATLVFEVELLEISE
jgi:FKBP-type peptidyl-prolyl cis-trans isomerase